MAEPPDSSVYPELMFRADTFRFYLKSVKFYEQLLNNDMEALKADPDIGFILDEETMKTLPLDMEKQRVNRVRGTMERQIEQEGQNAWDYTMRMEHGMVRFLKSTAQLYLSQLKQSRDSIASKPNISRYGLETLDTRISQLEEKTTLGVFAQATLMPLLAQNVPLPQPDSTQSGSGLAAVSRPRPVVLSSIEIRDPELRARCLDLFEQFRADETTERLDTVVTEATRVLENRIRLVTGLPPDCVGVDLATAAFGGKTPALRVSEIAAEQEAAHLIYRGVFGFVRNPVHHQLVGQLAPERVLQILGLIDYLLFLIDGAQRIGSVGTKETA